MLIIRNIGNLSERIMVLVVGNGNHGFEEFGISYLQDFYRMSTRLFVQLLGNLYYACTWCNRIARKMSLVYHAILYQVNRTDASLLAVVENSIEIIQ